VSAEKGVETMISNEEYERTRHNIMYIGGLALVLDLVGFLARIEKAEAVGPIANPTLYAEGAEQLQYVKAMALAVAKVRDEALKQAKARGIDLEQWLITERARLDANELEP
jgi:hypothetical protein